MAPPNQWPPPPGPRRWGRGDLDLWHVLIGRNGCGKTTRARALALAYARAGCRVVVSDPDGQFTQLAPRSWESADAYREHLRKKAGQNEPAIVRFGDSAEVPSLLDLARELAASTGYVTPSVLVVDEGTAWSEATKKQADGTLLRATGRRRNDAVGVILLQQQPSMIQFQSMANATALDVFRLESDYAIRHFVAQLPRRVILAPPSGVVTIGQPGPTVDRESLVTRIPTLSRGQFFGIDKRFH